MNAGLELRAIQIDDSIGMSREEIRLAAQQIDRGWRRLVREGRIPRPDNMSQRDLIHADIAEANSKRRKMFQEKVRPAENSR